MQKSLLALALIAGSLSFSSAANAAGFFEPSSTFFNTPIVGELSASYGYNHHKNTVGNSLNSYTLSDFRLKAGAKFYFDTDSIVTPFITPYFILGLNTTSYQAESLNSYKESIPSTITIGTGSDFGVSFAIIDTLSLYTALDLSFITNSIADLTESAYGIGGKIGFIHKNANASYFFLDAGYRSVKYSQVDKFLGFYTVSAGILF